MPLKQEKPIIKIYYTIGEVALLSGKKISPQGKPIATSALRFWEKEFEFKVSKRTTSLSRRYTMEEIRQLFAIIYLLKVEKFTVSGARIKFNQWKLGQYQIPEQYLLPD